ncbi:hypothetical protein AZ012_004697 [Citrobacter amalonaticus]|nr:hypothetical protein AZ012_004697 [Citrobacter amalonaticus]
MSNSTEGLTMNQLAERNAEHVTKIAGLEARCAALAADNARLKSAIDATIEWQQSTDPENVESVRMLLNIKTTPTDAFLAEVLAQGRNEGINYAASRLAAAFNHGFVDKPLAEVYDVVRMMLTAKEDLANDPLPAGDGLSGEYAEKFLQEFAAQLRQGGAA